MAPGSAVPSGKADQTLLFLMRPFPHGVLDTSAESIPNFETKNKQGVDAFPRYVDAILRQIQM